MKKTDLLVAAAFLALGITQTSLAEELRWASVEASSGPCKDHAEVRVLETGAVVLSFHDVKLDKESTTRSAVCHSLAKITLPKGYSFAEGLTVEAQTAAVLERNGDKVVVGLTVEALGRSEQNRKGILFETEHPEPTPQTLTTTVKIPAVGSCEADVEVTVGIHALLRLNRGQAESQAAIELKTITVAPVALAKMDCETLPN